MSSPSIPAGTWTVDPAHSSVGFTVRHLMISKVHGTFGSFSGTVTIAENPLESSLTAVVQTASISTGDAGRDGHVANADFFDVENFPTMTLVSTGLRAKGDEYVLSAVLTIKDVTQSVDFDLEFDGTATDPWGNAKAGFSAEAEISRKHWGLDWNMPLETGGFVIGDKIKIQLDIQVVKA
jgi:polyisoprenoid-binding protein YceI